MGKYKAAARKEGRMFLKDLDAHGLPSLLIVGEAPRSDSFGSD